MNPQIEAAYRRGDVVLFLGAGASASSSDAANRPLLTGSQLAKELAVAAGLAYGDEPLSIVYGAARGKIGDARVFDILKSRFKMCRPSAEYLRLTNHLFRRIYSLNIDDSLQRALVRSGRHFETFGRKDPVVDIDQLFQRTHLITLNGSIDRPQEGLIFSSEEYAKESAEPSRWYEALAVDYFRYNFLFIGTRLNESALAHHIEAIKRQSPGRAPQHTVLIRHATDIEIANWESQGFKCIKATLNDFVSWLDDTFRPPLTPVHFIQHQNPTALQLLRTVQPAEQDKYIATLSNIYPVSRALLEKETPGFGLATPVRDFYRGYKPTWRDVLDGVPGWISAAESLHSSVTAAIGAGRKLIPVVGPAGAGKSTLLKQVAFRSSEEGVTCFTAGESLADLRQAVVALQHLHRGPCVLFIDRLEPFLADLDAALESVVPGKFLLVGAERKHVWWRRIAPKLGANAPQPFEVETINDVDADIILRQLEKFGPWTRLAKLSPKERKDELLQKARNQLLIGLLEATSGDGFTKLIENEYKTVEDPALRDLIAVTGLATVNRFSLPIAVASRAMMHLGHSADIANYLEGLKGIVTANHGRLYARHPVFVAELFEQVITKERISEALVALIRAYAVYDVPVIRHLSRADARVFKAIMNYRFVRRVLKGDETLSTRLYWQFEKAFEQDGLFWLQYGLLLRSFQRHEEALHHLRTAVSAYRSDHAQHSLAQQQLILARMHASKSAAESLLAEARENLERLDKTLTSDAYPLVTLARGHTAAAIHLYGDAQARKIAQMYIPRLEKRREGPGPISDAYIALMKYAVGGEWTEAGYDEEDWH